MNGIGRQPVEMAVQASSVGEMPPIWREPLWPIDWLSLRMSPVYYGAGVPPGDGGPVVLVPGFMGVDAYLAELYMWLRRVGYRPYMSRIGLNAECPGKLTKKLTRTIERAAAETGRKVRIIGHSLGGVLGRKACQQRPDIVSQLIYLGSPVQAVHAHPAVIGAAVVLQAARGALRGHREKCLTQECGCGFTHGIGRPLPGHIRHAAIYTRADGVVDWHDSLEKDPRLNHEVGGTHVGLVFNPRAYRVLGSLLSGKHA